MKLLLQRDLDDGTCSQGRLAAPGYSAYTIERPWVPSPAAPCGTKGVSCIPPGLYQLVPHSSEAHPDTWALVNPGLWVYHWDEDVPAERRGLARTVVLLHPANIASELRGCIAPGLVRSVRRVERSRDAMAALQALLVVGSTGHELEIA